MSLITDALKTAQRQRSDSAPVQPQIPVLGGFFPDSGHRREPAARWRGAAAGGAIGLLLIAGAFSVREWRALHQPDAATGSGAALPLRSATLAATKPRATQTIVAPTRSDSAPAAAQQGEQMPKTIAPPARVAAAKPDPVARAIARPSHAIAQPAPTIAPPMAAPASVPPSGVRVSVQGGIQDASDRLLEQARSAQRQGNDAAAEDVYRRAVASHQANAEIYNNYAALLADRGDTTRAINTYKLALALDPTYVDAWSNLGTLFDASGDHRQATGVFQKVLALDSTNVAAREGLAEQYQALGDLSAARKLFEQVTRQSPDYARAHYQLALLLDGQSDAAGATREYSLFLQTAGDRYPQVYSDRVRARIAALSVKKP